MIFGLLVDMSQRVLWILFCSLLTTVCGVNDCLPSREAYVNLGLGDAEDVPTEFVSGNMMSEYWSI